MTRIRAIQHSIPKSRLLGIVYVARSRPQFRRGDSGVKMCHFALRDCAILNPLKLNIAYERVLSNRTGDRLGPSITVCRIFEKWLLETACGVRRTFYISKWITFGISRFKVIFIACLKILRVFCFVDIKIDWDFESGTWSSVAFIVRFFSQKVYSYLNLIADCEVGLLVFRDLSFSLSKVTTIYEQM